MTGQEIKKIRTDRGLSQRGFAELLGLGPFNVTVSRWERGKCAPSRLAEKAIRAVMESPTEAPKVILGKLPAGIYRRGQEVKFEPLEIIDVQDAQPVE